MIHFPCFVTDFYAYVATRLVSQSFSQHASQPASQQASASSGNRYRLIMSRSAGSLREHKYTRIKTALSTCTCAHVPPLASIELFVILNRFFACAAHWNKSPSFPAAFNCILSFYFCPPSPPPPSSLSHGCWYWVCRVRSEGASEHLLILAAHLSCVKKSPDCFCSAAALPLSRSVSPPNETPNELEHAPAALFLSIYPSTYLFI